MSKETTLRINPKTKRRLKKFGFIDEQWDDALKRLMDHCWRCDDYWDKWYS